jgi:protein-L-isoaspartate O-methyltransferase
MMTATYSPEDNKLRLYSDARLGQTTYERVKAAGFAWAPKKQLFVAPMWTPAREDLLLDLCAEIGDEDTSLVERAEERAGRFRDHSDRRAQDAERAHAQADATCERFDMGQPILIGHHSERRARRDKERAEGAMRRAVNAWALSGYWTDLAAGAIRHAKYKELHAVRARRMKTIEADKRKAERTLAEAVKFLRLWRSKPITWERAKAIANYDHVSGCYPVAEFPRLTPDASTYEAQMGLWSALDGIITPTQARLIACRCHVRTIRHQRRWIAHFENRLAYERAMLGESGGLATDKKPAEVGGAVRCWASPGHGAGWSFVRKVNKVSVTVEDNWGNGGKNFTRTISFDKVKGTMTRAEVDEARAAGRLVEADKGTGFYLRDAAPPAPRPKAEPDPRAEKFEQMAEALRAGVQMVTAPTLFPTPPEVARQVADLADIQPGAAVLEPSAGTGNLIAGLRQFPTLGRLVAVEINGTLADGLRDRFPNATVRCGDFLEQTPDDLGRFDRIVMNPPFDRGAHIKHVEHARQFLKPGGRLVAVVANGPRQRDRLEPITAEWIDLPEGTFKDQGTGVRTAIVVIDAEEVAPVAEPEPEAEPLMFAGGRLF